MNHKSLPLLSLVLIIVIACKKNIKSPVNTRLFKGLSSPVLLKKDTTQIDLTTYILHPEKIDSIASNKDYKIIYNTKEEIAIIPNATLPCISDLKIFIEDTVYHIPLFKNTKTEVVFSLPAHDSIQTVSFKSNITGWVEKQMNLIDEKWIFETQLYPGTYPYLFVINGKETLDPYNQTKAPNGLGGFNSILKIDSYLNKRPFIQTETFKENKVVIKIERPFEKILVYVDNYLLPGEIIKTENGKVLITIPRLTEDRHFLRIYAYNKFGRSNDLLIPLHSNIPIDNPAQLSRNDHHSKIMYFLMIDRFFDGTKDNNRPVQDDSIHPKVNFKGGDIQGVLAKLKEGYFDTLGINTLWISPIHKNPEGAYGIWPDPPTKFSGYHGYWPVSNIHIDNRFGNPEAFKQLLDEAHKKDMNVILDYVANHVHIEHPLYKLHPDWFTDLYLPDGTLNTEKWDSHRLTTWFDTFLPTIDFSKKETIDAMTDSALYWLKNYPIDGFRHDATKHIQLDFWKTLTRKIKTQIDRPVFQIGETYGNPQLINSYVHTGMLNAQFDFNLYDAAVNAFSSKNYSLQALAEALNESLHFYGYHHLMGNMSGNQDRVRFISFASGDVAFDEDGKMAGWKRKIVVSDTSAYNQLIKLHAFNFSVPGIPCIYYGDEIGMPGANDPDNRRIMRFSGWNKHEKELFNQLKKLIRLRKNNLALLYGTTQVHTDGNVMIIKRKYFDNEVYTIFNETDKPYIFQNHDIPAYQHLIITTNKIN